MSSPEEPIEDLIRRGYLFEFVGQEAKKYKDDKAKKKVKKPTPESTTRARNMNTIIEGPYYGGLAKNSMKIYAREARGWLLINMCNVSERPYKYFRGEAGDIIFTEAGARHVHRPHNNALVVTISIKGLKYSRGAGGQ